MGGLSKDPTPNTCVTVCGVSGEKPCGCAQHRLSVLLAYKLVLLDAPEVRIQHVLPLLQRRMPAQKHARGAYVQTCTRCQPGMMHA